MAKKDKKKKEINSVVKTEIIGVSLLAVSILLFFGIGTFSRLCGAFLIFFFGNNSFIIYALAFVYAITAILSKEIKGVKFYKFMALILGLVSLLVFTSLLSVEKNSEFLRYVDVLFDSISKYIKSNDLSNFSGGILGYTLATISIKLFNLVGTIIVFSALVVVSLLLFFQKPLLSFLKKEKKKNKVKINKVKKPLITKIKNNNRKMKIYDFEENVNNDRAEKVETSRNIQKASTMEISTSGKYELPPNALLANGIKNKTISKEQLKSKADILVNTFAQFGVNCCVVATNVGPTVTQFEIELQIGTKLSKVRNLSGELALALAAKDVRIQAPIPQKNTVGIEIPNDQASIVTLKEILDTIPKSEANKTVFVLGKDIMGKPVYTTLSKMPHLLVAGATGSGKSVCINSIIISLAMRATPSEVKMLMIDPKKVELSGYNGLPHLLSPVVTDPRKASMALQKIVAEMERRYDLFSDKGCKNFESYNQKMEESGLVEAKIPYIVVIVDELADLMLVACKDVEDSIMRITQMARAAGIHLIVATQRPSTDIITGVIKSNIPSRIAFGVSSSIDSRTILDSIGAEKLLGKGDMLFLPMGQNHPLRIQGAFLSEEEVENVVYYCSKQQLAKFDEEMMSINKPKEQSKSEDDLYEDVLEFVLENGSASTSLLQRKFRIGYNRASRLIDDLEMNGIIGPQNGSKPREVITDLVK
ncbi:MAG: DNA translocase FtsK 4TM domain-containing protein [Bacilli bacterium]